MITSANILLVEDDPEIARIVRDHLLRGGYRVTWASTGTEGWGDFQCDSYDLVLVDLMLPEMDGFTLCKHIRLTSPVPLFIMSARQEDESKVRGLNLGADDYITKPFSLSELTARISSHLRRFQRYLNQPEVEHRYEYNGGLTVHFERRAVYLNGSELILTGKEYALLLFLAEHPQRIFTKQELYEHIWGQADAEGNNTVTVHIKSLRDKLCENKRTPRFIQTVWGIGYKFIGERLS